MSNSIRISPDELGAAIAEQIGLYHENVEEALDQAGARAMKQLVERTRETAPFDAGHHGRHYADCIASCKVKGRTGAATHIWYVKAPCYRLTHLLVNGHATRDGGRTKADPFLKNAVDTVTESYLQEVEEVLGSGK